MSKVNIISQSCKGMEDCGLCAFVCPKDLFSPSGEMNEVGYMPPASPDEEQCTGCGNCMIYCPDFAIVVEAEPAEEKE